ncbi:hypothetical protein RB594_008844 [Gaeumannomyces avenae]
MSEPPNTPMPAGTPVPASTPITGTPPRSTTPLAHCGTPTNGHSITNGHSHTNGYPTSNGKPGSNGHAKLPNGCVNKAIVLHIGDPIQYNPDSYATFSKAFDVVRPSLSERQRPEFIKALREGRWGNFSAIFRPFWGTGGEMGKWDSELIDLLPQSCRVFASAGAGFDWADTQRLGNRGIIYCNSGLAAAEAVADFTVAMVLSTFRHLPWCMGAAIECLEDDEEDSNFMLCHALTTARSHNLRGHNLGIVGLGNIGRQLAAKLGGSAFGMAIHYTDARRKPEQVERELGVTYHQDISSLLAACDCIVLCVPPRADGRPVLDRAALFGLGTGSRGGHPKPGLRIVNVARGSLVDEEALADALELGVVTAAALDVHASEPRINRRLLRMARVGNGGAGAGGSSSFPGRVMLTCHNAGGTVETHAGFEELSMRNIMAVLGGGVPITPVNLRYLKKH